MACDLPPGLRVQNVWRPHLGPDGHQRRPPRIYLEDPRGIPSDIYWLGRGDVDGELAQDDADKALKIQRHQQIILDVNRI